MKTQCSRMFVCLSAFLLLPGPVLAGAQAEQKATDKTSQQRQQCDAACRENYQNNSTALQACLRDCGAIGPASAGAIAASPDGSMPAAQATTVKSAKSNSSDRQVAPVTPPPVPVEASNLNLSKSNINREAGEASDTPAESEPATTADDPEHD